ncbi:MAG: TraR/DksA C4-type zinc finger protein [Acidimicrobiia bacterium]|nr:TraR/DksA C4-type zinc finger protein [Acidimicrobiia bacterium]
MTAPSPLGRRHQHRLLGERDRLRDLLQELRAAATSRADYEPHDVTDDEAAIQADTIERRLVAIEAALDRINSGDYGRCLMCESPIAVERLEALSATTVCRDCAT